MLMQTEKIEYTVGAVPALAEIISLFAASGINRPIGEPGRIERMFAVPCLVVSARAQGRLVGVSRSLTDFVYCCYISDIAVDRAWQGRGIGKELIRLTREAVGDSVTVVLVSAAEAVGFYPKAGFDPCSTAFIVRRQR